MLQLLGRPTDRQVHFQGGAGGTLRVLLSYPGTARITCRRDPHRT
jgi:spermidine synthase